MSLPDFPTGLDADAFEDDIPEALALAAHRGTSHVPEVRAQAERLSYAQAIRKDYERFYAQAGEGGTLDLLAPQVARYREGVALRTRGYLASLSRCLSPMITGPSNFPTSRNQKRLDRAERKFRELTGYRARARAALLRALRPDLEPI